MAATEKTFEELHQQFLSEATVHISIISVYIVVGVLCNGTILIVYFWKMKGHINQRFFVPYLATVDLLSCTYNGSGKIILYLQGLKFDSDPLCKSGHVLGFILNSFSFWLLFTIALQRFLLICKMDVNFSKVKKVLTLAVGLLLSAAFGIPRYLYAGKTEFVYPGTNFTGIRCSMTAHGKDSTGLKIYTTTITVCLLILIFAIGVLYFLVLRKVRLVSRKMIRHSVSITSQSQSESETKMVSSGKISEKDGTSSTSGILRKNRLGSTKSDTSVRLNRLGSTKSDTSMRLNRLGSTKSDTSLRQKRRSADRNKITYMFALITLTALLTGLPRIILERIESSYEGFFFSLDPVGRGFYMFFHGLYILNNAVDPFIYGLFDAVFRKKLNKCISTIAQIKLCK